MRSDRFKPLLFSTGPFASIYFDDSHDTPYAATQLSLRWREIRDGVDGRIEQRVVDDLEQAVMTAQPAVGRSGRALIAGRDGVVLDDRLLRGESTTVVRVSALPYILPIVTHGMESPTYAVVAVDHHGADITMYRAGREAARHSIDGGGYPVHKAVGAETPDYGDPQPRAEEGARKNVRAVARRLADVVEAEGADIVFVTGEVRYRSDLIAAVRDRVTANVIELTAGARNSTDDEQLAHQVDTHLQSRGVAVIDGVAQQFRMGVGRDDGLAVEGLAAVCAALRDGAVDTLIGGEMGDATVTVGESKTAVAPNADVLSEWGWAPSGVARADEALPLAAVAVDASLVRMDERLEPADGIGATLRYPLRSH